LYTESFREEIIIKESQGTIFEDQQGETSECFPWEEKVSEQEATRCISACEYKAKYEIEAVPA
jgi:hypothetical protein